MAQRARCKVTSYSASVHASHVTRRAPAARAARQGQDISRIRSLSLSLCHAALCAALSHAARSLSLSLSLSLSPIATVAFEVWQTTVVLEARGASGFRDVTGGQLPRRNGAWRVCRVCERRRTHFTLCHSHTKNLKQCSVFLSHKQERRHTQTTKYMAATTAGSVRTALCFRHGAAPPAWKTTSIRDSRK